MKLLFHNSNQLESLDIIDEQCETKIISKFRKYYLPDRIPVVFSHLSSSWRALKHWQLKYFSSNKQLAQCKIFTANLVDGLSHPPHLETKRTLKDVCNILAQQQQESLQLQKEIEQAQEHITNKQTRVTLLAGCSHQLIPTSILNDSASSSSSSLVRSSYAKRDSLLYIQQVDIATQLAPLKQDYDDHVIEKMFYGQAFGANTLFVGTYPTRTSLHFDRPLVDNLFHQIVGKKRIRLWRPTQGVHFNMFKFPSQYAHVSKIVDIDYEAQQDNSDFAQSQLAVDLILNAGDSLYIPKGWFHQVSHVPGSLSISMNHWYY